MSVRSFTLTEEHIALLRHANVGWQDLAEWGGPWIDPKRPFGNGNHVQDMDRILGGYSPSGHREDDVPPSRRGRYLRLYRDLATALEIVLSAATFEPGTYEARDYGRDWHRVEEPA